MNTEALRRVGAYFWAGHMDCPSPSPMLKYAAGLFETLAKGPLAIDPGCVVAPVDRIIRDPGSPIYNGLFIGFEGKGPAYEALADIREGYCRHYELFPALETMLDDEERRLLAVNGHATYQHLFNGWQGHATLDYRTILACGLPWYGQRIQCGRQAAGDAGNEDKVEFFTAVATVMSGVMLSVQRHASACRQLAESGESQGNPGRTDRLRRLAGAFEQFLVGPPRDFFEALLLVHFMNALDGFDNVGRLDQYLYPFYKQDRHRGALTADEAADLLQAAMDIWGKRDHWQVVLGGTDANGRDASNELTELILASRSRVRHPKPSLSLRLSSKSSDRLLHAGLELLAAGVGQPAFYNDELYVRAWRQLGAPAEDAAEVAFGGCTETHIAGKSSARDAFFNVAKAIEAVFYNGAVSPGGPQMGVETGPLQELDTFDKFLAAYKRQVEYLVNVFVRCRNKVQQVVARVMPALVRSIFVGGCLDSGVSNSAGGSTYDYGMIDVYGLPNAANSLMAVRKLVYEQRAVSLEELSAALACNFAGHEPLRAACLRLPKYGNDLDEVDTLAADIADHLFEYVLAQKLWNGDGYYAFCASAPGMHVYLGQATGATPDGRLATTPLANSMGPMQATDWAAPTAVLRSVAKLPLAKCVGTPVVNLSLSPELVAPGNRQALGPLIRTFFQLGGMQLQINVTDRATLADAIAHPETHRSLIVRVSGFAARFTELPPEIQAEIASRNVH